MAKTTFTQATYDTDNIQTQANQVKGQAATLKLKFDQTGIDNKAFVNTSLIAEIEETTSGDSGANKVGINAVGVTADNVNDAVAEVQANVAGATLGLIPNNTLTEAKMVASMKKQAGGVAEFDTVTVIEAEIDSIDTSIADNVTAIGVNATNLDILRLAKDTTGSANAYIVDTEGTFDFTQDGNMLTVNPNFTNTGSSTIAVDGTTKGIRKFDIDTDAYVILEADDIYKNTPVTIRYDVSESFFVYAPKGGGTSLEVLARGTATMSTSPQDVTIPDVGNIAEAFAIITPLSGNNISSYCIATGEIINTTTLRLTVSSPTRPGNLFNYEIIKVINAKSIQQGTTSWTSTSQDVTISTVDNTKCLTFISGRDTATAGSDIFLYLLARIKLIDNTTIRLENINEVMESRWTVVEFN